LFAVERDAPGTAVTALHTLDHTRTQTHVSFHETPATLIGAPGAVVEALASADNLAMVALAAEQTGAAEHLMQLCVDYAKLRYQFGKPIGPFQAIKHKLADMAFDVERMGAVSRRAAEAADADDKDFPIIATIAKVHCSEAFFRVAAETIQVHGGIGFTWEHSAHLYFRRAKSSEFLLGAPAHHRERLLSLVGA
jgi:alkylation response protein AidB-like acyl-CoA dehydrogenase